MLGNQALVFAQEVSAKLGVVRTMKSSILNEERKVLVHPPATYDTSGKAYPVLYLLDGTPASPQEAITVTNRLRTEMIILAIENTNRNRDMMPVGPKTIRVRLARNPSSAFWRRNSCRISKRRIAPRSQESC